MIEVLFTFHSTSVIAALMYYFKFSQNGSAYFKENRQFISNIKNNITDELTKEISQLVTPLNVIELHLQEGKITYDKRNINPPKGEKFKNWLGNYLIKEMNFFILYYEFKKTHIAWKKWSAFLKGYSIFVAIFQILNLLICFYLLYFNTIDLNEWKILICSGLPAVIFLVVGILMIFYKDTFKNKIINMRDEYHGL